MKWQPAPCRFARDTSGVIFESILNKAPASPVRINPEVNPELERIIDKALEKDRDTRYQHAGDLLADLKRLKRQTESSRVAVAQAVPEKRLGDTQRGLPPPVSC